MRTVSSESAIDANLRGDGRDLLLLDVEADATLLGRDSRRGEVGGACCIDVDAKLASNGFWKATLVGE